MPRKSESDDSEFKDLAKALEPILEKLNPILETQAKANAPIVKRAQWMNFVIMFFIVVAIVGLAYLGRIDGSAATGLLGAIVGYVFGNIYSKKN